MAMYSAFIMEVEKVPWREAVEMLARKAGMRFPQGYETKRDQAGDFFRAVQKSSGASTGF